MYRREASSGLTVGANLDFALSVGLSMVMLDTRVRVTRRMVDNDESGALKADVTIPLSSRSVVVLCLPLSIEGPLVYIACCVVLWAMFI